MSLADLLVPTEASKRLRPFAAPDLESAREVTRTSLLVYRMTLSTCTVVHQLTSSQCPVWAIRVVNSHTGSIFYVFIMTYLVNSISFGQESHRFVEGIFPHTRLT